MEFITRIKKSDVDVDFGDDVRGGFLTMESAFLDLKWTASISAGSQGISSISAIVPAQEITVSIEIEVPTKDGEDFEYVHEERVLKITDVEIEYTRGSADDSTPIGLAPGSISCYAGHWIVRFDTCWF